MSDLDAILEKLVDGNEDEAKTMFHNMVVNTSKAEYNKLQTQPETPLTPEVAPTQ